MILLKREQANMLQRAVILFLGFAIGQIFLSSCDNAVTCHEDIQRVLNAKFYTLHNRDIKDTTFTSFSAYGTDRPDSSFYNSSKSKNISSIQLTLSPVKDTSSFIFTFINSKKDTLSDKVIFYYKRTPVMISEICGFTDDFTITGVTTTHEAIDSIAVPYPNLSTTDEENVKIFF